MIIDIRARFSCSECGKLFSVEIDPAAAPPPGWSMFEMAEDSVRGSVGYDVPDGHCCSVSDGYHLCGRCTKVEDEKVK